MIFTTYRGVEAYHVCGEDFLKESQKNQSYSKEFK